MAILLISILLFLILLSVSPPTNDKLKLIVYIVIGIILAISAGYREGWADYQDYISGYNYIVAGETVTFEISYILIAKFVNLLIGDVVGLFIIYGILGVTLKMLSIKQLTDLWFLSLIVYIGNFYILHELIQIRVGVAAGFLLLCIKPIYDRDVKRFLFFFICAFFFHYSALVILPLWLLNSSKPRKLFLYGIVPLAYLIFILKINLITTAIPIPQIKDKIELYQSVLEMGQQNEINVFNLVFLVKVIIYYLLLWKIDLIYQNNKYSILMMKIYSVSLFSFPAFAIMPVIGFRISELYGIVEFVLFPLLIYIVKPRFAGKVIVMLIGLVLFCIAVFYIKYFSVI